MLTRPRLFRPAKVKYAIIVIIGVYFLILSIIDTSANGISFFDSGMKFFGLQGKSSTVASKTLSGLAFTPGNLVIVRVGNGGGISLESAPTYLVEYTTAGVLVQAIAIPSTGPSPRLTVGGLAPSEGQLVRSGDGHYLTFAGYDVVAGSSNYIVPQTPRVFGIVDGAGTVYLTTALTEGGTGEATSAASTNGIDLWMTNSALRYKAFGSNGSSTLVSGTLPNTRVVKIFNGQLYMTSGTNPFTCVNSIGSGTPTGTGNVPTRLPGMTCSNRSPFSFSIDPSGNSMYVADDGTPSNNGGIQKWTKNAGTWSNPYTFPVRVRGLTVDWSGAHPVIYATTTFGELISVTDTGSGSATVTLATSPQNTFFQGVDFAPELGGTPLPTPTITNTSTPTATRTSTNTPTATPSPFLTPTIATLPATFVENTSATMSGAVNPNNHTTTVWFRYSAADPGSCNDSFGSVVGTDTFSGNTTQTWSRAVGFLNPGTTYYFCAIGSNNFGTALGELLSFTTPLHPPTPTPTFTPTATSTSTTTPTAVPTPVNTPPGTLDYLFGSRGLITTTIFSDSRAHDIVIQQDGKIVVAAEAYDGVRRFFATVRYSSGGAPDPTFGDNGRALTLMPFGNNNVPQGVALQSDGKILVAGKTEYNPPNGSFRKFALVRYNTDGSLDTTFDNDGIVITQVVSDGDVASDLCVQPDGKIIVVGSSDDGTGNNSLVVVRYNADGSLDPSFDLDGKVVESGPGSNLEATSCSLQPDGRIVVAGYGVPPSEANNAFSLLRYNSDGSLDTTFGNNGIVFTKIGNVSFGKSIAIRPDGKIIVAGAGSIGSTFVVALTQYNADGSLDSNFGTNGIFTSTRSSILYDILLQNDGKIVAVGGNDASVSRYNANGSLDTSFGNNGFVFTSFPVGASGDGVALQSDGKIVTTGSSYNGGSSSDIFVARYLAGANVGNTPTPTSTLTNTPTKTPTNTATATATSTPSVRTAFDYDGDHSADVSVFRPTDGAWYIQQSQAGLYGTLFGFGSDKIGPADYDGDGKTDIAVYRPTTGIWYVLKSSNGTVEYYVFGLAEDLPTPADYDGDGKADVSVYRPSTGTWYRQNSGNGSFTGIQFGASEDKPTIGDFDGDGKSDIAVFRPSTGAWYRINSGDGSIYGELFGFGTDIITPADYDGDGKTDLAAYRPTDGIWYLKYSSNSVYDYKVFGLANDIPAPADFDGDGKADICVFRSSDGTWYRQNSSDGAFIAFQFGANGDKPTMTAFRY